MVHDKAMDLFIIGTQKAGTSSLREYLTQHPEIVSHHTNELPFFTYDQEYEMGFEAIWKSYYLPIKKPAARRVVAKNVLVMYSETALKRLRQHNPNAHIVVLLRNPANRAYSAYWYARRREEQGEADPKTAIQASVSSRDFSSVEKFNTAYLEIGKYANYLKMVFEIFPVNQIHIYTVEDLKANTQKICNEMFALLDLPPFVVKLNYKANAAAKPRYPALAKALYADRAANFLLRALPHFARVWLRKTKIKVARWNDVPFDYPPMSAELRQWLIDFYLPYNQELEALLQRDLSHWNQ